MKIGNTPPPSQNRVVINPPNKFTVKDIIIIMPSPAAPLPAACQRLFPLKCRTAVTKEDDEQEYRHAKRFCRLLTTTTSSERTISSQYHVVTTNMMPILSNTSFELVLKENIFQTPYSRKSKAMDTQSLQFPSLDDDEDDEIATCMAGDRHEISPFTMEEDEKEDTAARLRDAGTAVTPLMDSDGEDDDSNPRPARINLASRFEVAAKENNKLG